MDRKVILNRMRRNPFFVSGTIAAIIVIIIMVAAPYIIQFDPEANSLIERFTPPEYFSKGLQGHILGTDQLGRDQFARLLIGGRYSLFVAFTSVVLQTVIGAVLGILAGYFGGWIDAVIMRAVDVVMSIPTLILSIAIITVLGPSIPNLIFVLTFSGWIRVCKLIRNNVRVVKSQEFVKASTVLGAKGAHIMFKQIFPNVTTHIIIQASQRVGQTIINEAALSFLQLGIQPPIPSWGNMISTGRQYMQTQPWLVFAPGIALMFSAMAFNFLGDGIRDVLDPKRTVV